MAYCCFLENNDCSNPLRTHISFHCFRRLVRLLFKNTNFNVTVTHKQLIQKNKPTFVSQRDRSYTSICSFMCRRSSQMSAYLLMLMQNEIKKSQQTILVLLSR